MLNLSKISVALLGLGLLAAGSVHAANEISGRWTRLNIDGGGLIGAVVVDPNNHNRVYALSDKGGLHRSDNAGESWNICNVGFEREPDFAIADLLIDDRNPGRLFVASGNGGWSWKHWYPGSIWRSDDNGDHWHRLVVLPFAGEGSPGKHFGGKLCFDPKDHNVVYAATLSKGLYVTRNGGSSWENLGFGDRFLTNVRFDPLNDRRILVSGYELSLDGARKGGFWESVDGGRNWKQLSNTPIDFFVFNRDGKTVAAVCGRGDPMLSRDGGRTWNRISRPEKMKGRIFGVAFQGDRLWVWNGGQRGAAVSCDFGKSWQMPLENWQKVLKFPHGWYISEHPAPFTAMAGLYALTVDPANDQRMYIGDFFGVWRSDNGGLSWTAKPFGLNSVCVFSIAVDPCNSNNIYVTNADVGLLRSTDGGQTFNWPDKEEGLINAVSRVWISPRNPRHLVAVYSVEWRRPHWTDVVQSFDGGKSWKATSRGLPCRNGGYLTGLVALDDDGKNLVVGFGGERGVIPGNVYGSEDGGMSWKPFGSGLPNDRLLGHNWEILPNLERSGEYLFALTWGGLYRCSLADRKWVKVGQGIGHGQMRTLAVAPSQPGKIFVGTAGAVYVSTDNGEHFEKRSSGEMIECRSIAVDPKNPAIWYVAIAAQWWSGPPNNPGIYVTTDDGKSFRRLRGPSGDGMAWRITADPAKRGVIYVGTNGIGAWKVELDVR